MITVTRKTGTYGMYNFVAARQVTPRIKGHAFVTRKFSEEDHRETSRLLATWPAPAFEDVGYRVIRVRPPKRLTNDLAGPQDSGKDRDFDKNQCFTWNADGNGRRYTGLSGINQRRIDSE